MRLIGLRLPILAVLMLASSLRAHPGSGSLSGNRGLATHGKRAGTSHFLRCGRHLRCADLLHNSDGLRDCVRDRVGLAGADDVRGSHVLRDPIPAQGTLRPATRGNHAGILPANHGLLPNDLLLSDHVLFAHVLFAHGSGYCCRNHRLHDGPLQRLLWGRDDRRRRARGSNVPIRANAGCHHSGSTNQYAFPDIANPERAGRGRFDQLERARTSTA